MGAGCRWNVSAPVDKARPGEDGYVQTMVCTSTRFVEEVASSKVMVTDPDAPVHVRVNGFPTSRSNAVFVKKRAASVD